MFNNIETVWRVFQWKDIFVWGTKNKSRRVVSGTILTQVLEKLS